MKLCGHHGCLSSGAFLSLQRRPHAHEASSLHPVPGNHRCGLCPRGSACSGNFLSVGSCSRRPLLPSLFHFKSISLRSLPSRVLSQLLVEPCVVSPGDGAGLGGGGGEFGWTRRIGLGRGLLRPLSDDAEMQTASAVRNVYKALSSSASTLAETVTCFLFLFLDSISSPKDGWEKKTVLFT